VSGFVKIYGSMLDSSIWGEDPTIRVVWITLLAMADETGYIDASVGGIARRAVVDLEACRGALGVFQAPDPDSKDIANEGRRLRKTEHGWLVLNYRKYREMQTEEQRRWADQKRKQREGGHVRDVQSCPPESTTKAEADRKADREAEAETGIYLTDRQAAPANPLIAGRRTEMERDAYRLIREVNALEPDKDPTEILLEAARWEGKDGRSRSKVRVEAMTDDHLIRTVHDLKANLEMARKKHGAKGA